MYKYAQIILDSGECIAISELSSEVVANHMIPLFEMVEQVQSGEPDEEGNTTTISVFVPVPLNIEVNPGDIWDGTSWTPAPIPEPESTSESKIKELNASCNAAILAGFTSESLGSENFYDFDYDAQINLGGMLNAITAGIGPETIVWKASGIPQPHTVEQFKQVFVDGLRHKNDNISRYWTLKSQVLAAETSEEIEAIQW